VFILTSAQSYSALNNVLGIFSSLFNSWHFVEVYHNPKIQNFTMPQSRNIKLDSREKNFGSVGNNKLTSMSTECTEVAPSTPAADDKVIVSQYEAPVKELQKLELTKDVASANNSTVEKGSDEWIVLNDTKHNHKRTNHDDEFDCILLDDGSAEGLEPAKPTQPEKHRSQMSRPSNEEVRKFAIELAASKARILQSKIELILLKNESFHNQETNGVQRYKKEESPEETESKKENQSNPFETSTTHSRGI
jgi:hypothetical protein